MKRTTTENKTPLNSHSLKPFFKKGGEETFFSKKNELGDTFFIPSTIQPKLKIGRPGDKYEQEADFAAEKVVKNLEGSKSPSSIESKTESNVQQKSLQRIEEKDEETKLNKKSIFESEEISKTRLIQGNGIEAVDPNIESQLKNNKGSGQSLDSGTKTDMEQSFSANFAAVKVHTGSAAVQMNQKLGAEAFTNGNDIYFNKGNYNPNNKDGRKLLAHELTHVVQQNSFITTKHTPSLYRKEINEFQQANTSEKISASQKRILEPQKSVDVKHKDTSQSLRRCIAGCSRNPSSPPPSFSRGDKLAVNTLNKEGWIQGRLGDSASGAKTSFPDYLKVDYLERRDDRDYFTIMEGPYNGQTASLQPGFLESGITWEGPARVTFREDSSKSKPLQSEGTLDYGGGTANAKIYIDSDKTKISADRDYPLRLPDAPHAGGSSYGDYAKTWFHIIGGPQGDEYLHRGRTSAGCVTVTSDVWPAIYHHLIKKRDGTQNIGIIRRVIV